MSMIELGKVCKVSTGQPAPKANAFSSQGFPFIRAGSLEKLLSGEPEGSLELISEEMGKKLRLKLFPKGTVVFAKSGMSATLGRVYQLKGQAFLVSHLAAVVPSPKVWSNYLRYWFLKNPPSRLIANDAYPSIRTSEISSLNIPFPPLEEQKRIAAILDKADGIRRKRQQIMAMADRFLRSVFLDMFGDPVTNPKGWKTERVKNIGKVTTGNTPSRSIPEYYGDDIEWIKSDNINTPFHYLTRATEGLSAKGKSIGRTVGKDAILVTCIAGSPDCIGNIALTGREVAFNQQINALETNEQVDSLFMYSQLMVGKKLIQKASTNSMKGMVSKGKFELISVMVPPTNLQLEFSKIFRHQMKTAQDMAHESEQANTLFTSISQDAFQGTL